MRRRTRARIGRLRHRVLVQTPPTTRGGRGQISGDWTDVETVSANVRSLNGRELEIASSHWADAAYTVEVRKPDSFDFEIKQRIVFRTINLEIGYVPGLEKQPGEPIELLCKVVSSG